MKQKLADGFIRCIIGELKKGKSIKTLADEVNMIQRHVQRLPAKYRKMKTVHIRRPAGRPKSHGPSDEESKTVLDARRLKPNGAVRTTNLLKKAGHSISRYHVYRIMKSNDLVVSFPAKSGKRKWIGF